LSVKSDALMTPGPRAGQQAGGDVLAVLLMLITAGGVDGVGDRSHQVGGTVAELPGQRREGSLPGAAGRDVFRMVFGSVVEQRGACYVGIGDPVVGDDPDGDPEQVVSIRFTLPPVPSVLLRCQRQRIADPAAADSREPRDLNEQPFAQAGFAVHGGDRVQRHAGH
jgi:hypothetical protein